MVKSHGAERLGKVVSRVQLGMDKRDERPVPDLYPGKVNLRKLVPMDIGKVSRSGYIQSKAVEYEMQ